IRNMPVTILDVSAIKQKTDGSGSETRENDPAIREIVVAAAEKASVKRDEPPTIDVIVRKHDVSPDEAIATEARSGYALLIVGVDDAAAKRGGFHETLSSLVRNFEGSIAIAVARNADEED